MRHRHSKAQGEGGEGSGGGPGSSKKAGAASPGAAQSRGRRLRCALSSAPKDPSQVTRGYRVGVRGRVHGTLVWAWDPSQLIRGLDWFFLGLGQSQAYPDCHWLRSCVEMCIVKGALNSVSCSSCFRGPLNPESQVPYLSLESQAPYLNPSPILKP